jgi:hypothetical protein
VSFIYNVVVQGIDVESSQYSYIALVSALATIYSSLCRSFYLITMFVVLSQVLAAAIVLPMNWDAPCDAPLNVWCTIYGMPIDDLFVDLTGY